MSLCDIRYRAPAPGGAAGMACSTRTLRRTRSTLTRKNVPVSTCLTLALVPVHGAFGRRL
jgi:hypothetical protein